MYTISTRYKYIHQVLEDLVKQKESSLSSPDSSAEEARSSESDDLPRQNNILIICSTRDEFLNQLEACINHEDEQHRQHEQEGQHSNTDVDAEPKTLTSPSSRHARSDTTATITPTKKVDEIPASQEDLGEALTRHLPTVSTTPISTAITTTTTANIADANDNSLLQSPTTTNHYIHPFQSQPTLHLLAASSQIKVVFCPNITTFRAYISTLPFQLNLTSSSPPTQTDTNTNTQTTPLTKNQPTAATAATAATSPQPAHPTKQSTNQPTKITIINLLSLHNHTSEFSLQGLSRTLSNLITSTSTLTKPHIPSFNDTSTKPTTTIKHNVNLTLIECSNIFDPTDHTNHGNALWDAKVPLLSGSVKVSEEGRKWVVGREVSVRDVVLRWFDFESGSEGES